MFPFPGAGYPPEASVLIHRLIPIYKRKKDFTIEKQIMLHFDFERKGKRSLRFLKIFN